MALSCGLAAAALTLTACGGTGGSGASTSPAASSPAAPASSAPVSSAPGSAGTTSSATTVGPASGSAASSTLSLDMPPALDGHTVQAVNAVVDLAAGPGAESGMTAHSPLERNAELRHRAATLDDLVRGTTPSAALGTAEQTCIDVTRATLQAEAETGAADVGFTVQPQTAATLGGGPTASPAPSFTASPKDEVTPLGVQVSVYPTEDAARAALERAREAAEACTDVPLSTLGVDSVEDLAHEGGSGFTALPRPEGAVYTHVATVQDGARMVSVVQADAAGGVPANADERAASITKDVLAALDSDG